MLSQTAWPAPWSPTLSATLSPPKISRRSSFPTYFYTSEMRGSAACWGFTRIPSNRGVTWKGWVINYSSWITPGLLGPNSLDLTAVSHEIAETYNDPFVVGKGGRQSDAVVAFPERKLPGNRETGDVIGGLPRSTFPASCLTAYIPSAERSAAG